MTEMNLSTCTDQITIVSVQSYCGKNRDTSLIIQTHQPTYKKTGQNFHG